MHARQACESEQKVEVFESPENRAIITKIVMKSQSLQRLYVWHEYKFVSSWYDMHLLQRLQYNRQLNQKYLPLQDGKEV